MTDFTVGEEAAGRRLDVLLAERLGISRSRAAAAIEAGRVRVDDRVADKSDRPSRGQAVTVSAPEPRTATPPPPVPPVRWRDEHLLVVSKPAGLVVHPGAGRPDGTLVDALRAADIPLAQAGDERRPGIVHRLDRDTSGLMVVASTPAAHRGLVEALRRRRVRRTYRVLIEGTLQRDHGRIEGPVGRDPRRRTRFAVVADGKPAVTLWDVRGVGAVGEAAVSLLECRLVTGRTHQIRVHLSEAGHPVVGDVRYRASSTLAAELGLDRPFLHAASLSFTHPVTGEEVAVTEPLPDELAAAAAQAGLTPDPG